MKYQTTENKENLFLGEKCPDVSGDLKSSMFVLFGKTDADFHQ